MALLDGRGALQKQAKNSQLVNYEDLKYAENDISLDPNDAYAWYRKGAALNNLGRYKEALGSFDKAIEINPKLGKAWYNKGSALVELRENTEAIKCFDKAIEIDPNDPYAWYHKGA